MGNIKNFNFNKIDLKITNHDYWDFYLAKDEYSNGSSPSGVTSGDCFVVWYDFNNASIFENSATTASTIYSLVSWDKGINTGYTFPSYGLTGLDNGHIFFEKNPLDPTNQNLVDALTGTSLVIQSGNTKLSLTQVTGYTKDFIYPMSYNENTISSVGGFMEFCGGFYQGYYKIDGSTYEVLPNRMNSGWSSEFWLISGASCTGLTGTTLNDEYPNNKGFFFYMGTRAENKFWNKFEGDDTGCLSACTATTSACTGTVSTFCTVLKEPEITIIGDYGFGIPLNPPRVEIDLITNNFLIYGRAYDSSAKKLSGETDTLILSSFTNTFNVYERYCDVTSRTGLGTKQVGNYDGKGIAVAKSKEVITDFTNPFLIYGRGRGYCGSGCTCSSCCGPNDGYGSETISSYSGKTSLEGYIDYNLDIIDNAIGFRIKDDGSIGYRMLTVTGTCYTASTGERLYTSGVTIQEGYSEPNMISTNDWNYIVIKYETNYLDDCELITAKQRTGKLMFYVNAKLKYVVNDFPEHMAKRLDEYKAKQVGVPFNFSLGGGSQGLKESQTFDGLDMEDRGLPIEENFAGTFIGGISQFKFNICPLTYENIRGNYLAESFKYRGVSNFLLTDEDNVLIQEDNYGLLLD